MLRLHRKPPKKLKKKLLLRENSPGSSKKKNRHANVSREEIGEGNACSKGYHGQDNGHAGFFDCAVISVQKEKASYSAVKRSLYSV